MNVNATAKPINLSNALANAIEALQELKDQASKLTEGVTISTEAASLLVANLEDISSMFEDDAIPKEDIQDSLNKVIEEANKLFDLV